jgi:hypothetical protein
MISEEWIANKCDSDRGINQSKYLRRIVLTTRSQIAFVIGQRGGDFNTLFRALLSTRRGVRRKTIAVVKQIFVLVFESDGPRAVAVSSKRNWIGGNCDGRG